MRFAIGVLVFGGLSAIALGPVHAITVDGTLDPSYGPPLAYQAVETAFGNNRCCGAPNHATGSELDAAYGTIDVTTLRLFFSGNLQTNGNCLEVFIDCIPGGQNRLCTGNPSGVNRMSDNGSGNGLRFDGGFEADFYLGINALGPTPDIYARYSTLPTGGGGFSDFLGTTTPRHGTLSGGTNPHGIEATFNNANTIGVAAGCGPNMPPLGVMTGMEFAIPLAALGSAAGCFNVVAFINDPNHAHVSNQMLPAITPQCNLGEPRNINLALHDGPQFFTVCDHPTFTEKSTWGRVKVLYR